MVNLYGVVHGGSLRDIFGAMVGELELKPSEQFLHELENYPRGTKVGIEYFSKKDLENIESYLEENRWKRPHITFHTSNCYWNEIIDCCKEAGHEINCLDGRDMFKKYISQLTELAIYSGHDFFRDAGRSELKDSQRRTRINERIWRMEVKLRGVHEIERDNKLLENIKNNNVDVAIVGIAHGDYWFGTKNEIKKKVGIDFETYSADNTSPGFNPHYPKLVFIKNAPASNELICERECLEKMLNFIETGRIMQHRKPDYVGIWNSIEPSKGYFEMFVEENNNGKIKGKIEDFVGTAAFQGKLDDTWLKFTKLYSRGCENAVKTPIIYRMKKNEKGFYGYYFVPGFAKAVFMMKSQKENPAEMALRLDNQFVLNKKDKNWQKEFMIEDGLAEAGTAEYQDQIPF